ncbi:MAG: hypothetical protein IKX74_04725 [Erysipelotrichaceae bacterium]|nr:hypothetical protein [Erysipelotrichaceae bacterium]
MSENLREQPSEAARDEGRDFPFQGMFIVFSIISLLLIGAFYGYRYYRNVRNGVSQNSLSAAVIRDNAVVESGDGLYSVNGIRIFRGSCDNNYVLYSGLLWRIMQVNGDNTVRLIAAQDFNQLPCLRGERGFTDSQLHDWLNGQFLSQLDQSCLSTTRYYGDQIASISACITEDIAESTVSLCDVASWLNSVISGHTYLSDLNSSFWLANTSDAGAYRSAEGGLTVSDDSRFYGIRPVITLKADTPLVSGTGRKDDPYRCQKEAVGLGSEIRLGSDSWIVYGVDENCYRLIRKQALEEPLAFGLKGDSYDPDDQDTLAHYLNNEYLSSLPYQDLLREADWSCGDYAKELSGLAGTTLRCKVALASLLDIKLSQAEDYWLTTTSEKYAYTYGKQAELFRPTLLKNVVPAIAISRDTRLKLNADGSYEAGE